MAEWGNHHQGEVETVLRIKPKRMPERSTYRRLLAYKVYETEIERMVGEYNQSDKRGDICALDGKALLGMSKREDGTFSREDFTFDKERNVYVCPAGKLLTTTGTVIDGETLRYLASTSDCRGCPLKVQCCPKAPFRTTPRSIYEEARDVARALAKTKAFEQSCRERKRVEMLFAHLKRILRLARLRLRGPHGAQFEFTMAAVAQNLRRLAKLVVRPPPAVAACVA